MLLGINPDDRDELYEFYKNDTSALNIDEFVCDEYFGDANLTAQTLSNIDAIVAAALRLYKENDHIHDSGNDVSSQIINSSMDCDGFNMQRDVILINSTFSVQSVSPNSEDVDVFFAPNSLFSNEINTLFSHYFGESLVPIFVATIPNATFAPSIDPTPSPTRSPVECPYNEFRYDITKECFKCGADDHNGYECKGGALFNVEYGYWVSSYVEPELSISPLHSITVNHSIISLQCPLGQCCVDLEGCDYFNSHLLCADNRNTSSVTCSRCNDGYDEMAGSFVCGECKYTDYALVSLLFILASIFTLFLLFIMSRPNALRQNIKQKEIEWHKLLFYDQKNFLIVLISKIGMYYYQGLSQILSAQNITPTSEFQKTLVTFFDFDISLFSSGNETGICFIGGIDSGIY
eukprot:930767_1